MVAISVVKTASDALNSKLSVISAGYEIPSVGTESYKRILSRIAYGLVPNDPSPNGNAEESNSKKQIPLVNAGYAVRMSIVSSILHRFLTHYDAGCNVIILGCGFDALGIWSLSFSESVKVYEFDCTTICDSKCKALVRSGILKGGGGALPDGVGCLHGEIDLSCVDNKNHSSYNTSSNDYSLLPVDLRNTNSVTQAFHKAEVDFSRPTIIITELVLAYLGEGATDQLLALLALELKACSGSLLFALEPVGPPQNSGVLTAFSKDYFDAFTQKLGRGTTSSENQFHPLGRDCKSIENRLQRHGFDVCSSLPTGVIAADLLGSLECPESFDEYASLALHLRCYAATCAFTYSTSMELAHRLCPWKEKTSMKNPMTQVDIRPITIKDEVHIRNLYEKIYGEYSEKYPSIKKMVKMALKTDLQMTPKQHKGAKPSILSFYRNCGGSFWVASLKKSSTQRDTEDKEHYLCRDEQHPPAPIIAGFICIRICNTYRNTTTFEIHRFAVDDKHRNMGIGKELLQTALEFVSSISGKRRLMASSPDFMCAANRLYMSNGFYLEEERLLGSTTINLRTFVKDL